MNKLYYGDNLHIMESKLKKHSVDLIYLDPPFQSDQTYNLIYSQATKRPIPEQAKAFNDTWELRDDQEQVAKTMPALMKANGVDDYYINFWKLWMHSLRDTQPHLLAYLIYMVERLVHMKAILKPTGSIYLHCDPTASHYIKVMMDGIFKHQNFQNEIIWKRTFAHGGAGRWGDVHDVILFYTASEQFTWNRVLQPLDESYVSNKYRFKDHRGKYRLVVLTGPGTTKGASGEPWRGYDPTTAGRHWAVPRRAIAELEKEGHAIPASLHDQLELLYSNGFIRFPKKSDGTQGVPEFKLYLPDGQAIQDIVTDIPPVNSQAKDRLGYQTQKPVPLLRRIIEASSNRGDVVFDPFCGCGTTIYAAQETGRRWIGCDVAILAVRLAEDELNSRYGLIRGEHYAEEGIPASVASATALFEEDPFQFEHWAVEFVEGFPTKKTRDRGVDGRIWFEEDDGFGVMVLSVKGGKIKPGDVRDVFGVLNTEPDARLAGLITLNKPSAEMYTAAKRSGTWEYLGTKYQRVQIVTVQEMLEEGRTFHTPSKVGLKSAHNTQGRLAGL